MSEKRNWKNFRPSKALWFWSCIGCIAATLLVGFAWLGWVSGGTADQMAADANEQGRASLAAELCVERFLGDPAAADRMAELMEQSTRQRDDYIEDNGWATFNDEEGAVAGAAQICADTLVAMDVPADGDGEDTAVN